MNKCIDVKTIKLFRMDLNSKDCLNCFNKNK